MKIKIAIAVILVILMSMVFFYFIKDFNEPAIKEKDTTFIKERFSAIIYPEGEDVKALYRNIDDDSWIFKFSVDENQSKNILLKALTYFNQNNFSLQTNATNEIVAVKLNNTNIFNDDFNDDLQIYKIKIGADNSTIFVAWQSYMELSKVTLEKFNDFYS